MGQSVDWNPAGVCPEYSAACQRRGVPAGSRPPVGSGQGVRVAPGWGAGQMTQGVQARLSGSEGSQNGASGFKSRFWLVASGKVLNCSVRSFPRL